MKHLKIFDKVLNFSAERYFKAAGDLFIYEEDYEAALYMVEKTLSLEPENTRALVLKGDILFCLSRDVESLQTLHKAIQLNPECAEAYISKAGVLDALGKHRKSLDYCNKAFDLVTAQNSYLLPSLYDQKLILLIRMNRLREARQLLVTSSKDLSGTDYNYLLSCYQPLIERSAENLKKKRFQLREKAKAMSIKVLPGMNSQKVNQA